MEVAATLYRAFVGDLLARLESLEGVRATIFFTPDGAEAGIGELLREIGPASGSWSPRRVPQGGGDLGERMERAFRTLLEAGGPAVIVGTDLPTLSTETLREAFEALERPGGEAVLGPALDGGYYLIGLNRPVPSLFADMPWSTEVVLELTRQRLEAAGILPYELAPGCDVDTAADLERLRDELDRHPDLAPATAALLEELRRAGSI